MHEVVVPSCVCFLQFVQRISQVEEGWILDGHSGKKSDERFPLGLVHFFFTFVKY